MPTPWEIVGRAQLARRFREYPAPRAAATYTQPVWYASQGAQPNLAPPNMPANFTPGLAHELPAREDYISQEQLAREEREARARHNLSAKPISSNSAERGGVYRALMLSHDRMGTIRIN